MPEAYWILLHIVVFCAALIQTVTGFGFGLIATPLLLIVLNSNSAIQIAILLSLLIALLLVPALKSFIARSLLKQFLIGSTVGIPTGFVIFLFIDLIVLKVLTGLVVMGSVAIAVGRFGSNASQSNSRSNMLSNFGTGLIGGIMNSSLAMPGVLPLVRMLQLGCKPETIRATVLAFFVFSYPLVIALQAFVADVTPVTLKVTAMLIPATLIGVVTGRVLSSRVNESVFFRIAVVLLIVTAFGLFINVGYSILR